MEHSKGYTLIEVVSVLSISLILLGGTSNLGNIVERYKSRSAIHEVVRLWGYARHSAISYNQVMTFCGLNAQNSCTKENMTSLVVFADINRNKKIDNDERVHNQFNLKDRKYRGVLRVSGGRSYIRFTALGHTKDFGTITTCHHSNQLKLAQQATINRMGRFHIARDTDGDGIPNNTNGKGVSCG